MPHIIWKTQNFYHSGLQGKQDGIWHGESDEEESDAEAPRSGEEAALPDASPINPKPVVHASQSDILLANACPPEFVSWRGSKGEWMIKAIFMVMKKRTHDLDVQNIFKRAKLLVLK